MADIKNNFRKYNRYFRLYEESEHAYIYAISNQPGEAPVYYEVFEKRPYIPFKAKFDGKEYIGKNYGYKYAYPSSQSFGVWAWTTPKLNKARCFMQKIEAKVL